jgi:toxin ParE1/3/4
VRRLVYSRAAQRDIDEIWDYSALRWSVDQAEEYVLQLTSACEGLAAGRHVGRNANDIAVNHFCFLAGSHTIYFTRDEHELFVARILHQSMDAPNRL